MDVDRLSAALTVEEKARLTAGQDMWTVAGLAAHGIPAITMTDGPNGARGSALLGAGRVSAACVPCGSALGATWDPALVQQVGAVLGEEARTKAARVLLAPTVNLPRSPLAGRSFESYSEDPLSTGTLAAAFIRGVQSRGVAATVKHLVGNEAEYQRTTISSDIDERALRELYLVPFELAVIEGHVMAVMTSYNRLNGSWCSEDPRLLTGVLRGEWGFDGVVMTDWFAVGSTVTSAQAGLDLQMPGPDRFYGAPLAEAVRGGALSGELLDRIAQRWLSVIDRLDAWADRPAPERAEDRPEHRRVARRAAAESTVLLRNDGVLPLVGTERIALIGPNAARAHIMGGGSAQLRAHRVVSLAQVMGQRWTGPVVVENGCLIDKTVPALPIEFDATFSDAAGNVVGTTRERDGRLVWFGAPVEGLDPDRFTFQARGRLRVGVTGEHLFTIVQAGRARLLVGNDVRIDGVANVPEQGSEFFGLGSSEVAATVHLAEGDEVDVVVEYSSHASFMLHGVKVGYQPPAAADLMGRAVAAAAHADVAVVVVGTSDEWETEGHDRETMHLPGEQDELVRRVCAANPRTVVIVNAGAPVQMDWATEPAAVLVGWLGGQEMAEALVDVLLGISEPAGRLPVSFPLRIEHTPAFGAFPGEHHHVAYAEGLLMGYRWYDSRQLPTAFAFGHGGSYTTFSWGIPVLSAAEFGPGEELVVEVPVTNTGTRRGAEVVQLYVAPAATRVFRPRRELKAFAKVWAEPGETVTARLVLRERAFAFWDPGDPEAADLAARLGPGSLVPAGAGPDPVTVAGWYLEAGAHQLLLARAIDDVVCAVEVRVSWAGRLEPYRAT